MNEARCPYCNKLFFSSAPDGVASGRARCLRCKLEFVIVIRDGIKKEWIVIKSAAALLFEKLEVSPRDSERVLSKISEGELVPWALFLQTYQIPPFPFPWANIVDRQKEMR